MELTLISALMRTLATVSTVAVTSSKGQAVSAALNYAATLVELGAQGEEKLKALTAEVQAMVDGTKVLSEDDFNGLKARSDAAHAAIQGA